MAAKIPGLHPYAYAAVCAGSAALAHVTFNTHSSHWLRAALVSGPTLVESTGCFGLGFFLCVCWYLRRSAGAALAYTVTHHRWVLACFLMPVSLLFATFWSIRSRLVFMMGSAPELHDARVADVQRQILEWRKNRKPGEKMCTARAGWLAMSLRVGRYKTTHRNIRVELRDVLEVNTDRCTVRVEPMVTMGQISATLEPLGWTLAVLPELDDLTVGGLICGCGVESSSHRFGMFQETLVRAELVMADGQLVSCSAEENRDLFYSVPWSHGTVGFLVAAELCIIPSKPWVRLEYHPCHTIAETLRQFTAASSDQQVDFVEGLVYSRETAVVMVGTMVSAEEVHNEHINSIGRWFKPWWFTHVEKYIDHEVGTTFSRAWVR